MPSFVGAIASPAAKASTAADQDEGWPSMIRSAGLSLAGSRLALTAMPKARGRSGACISTRLAAVAVNAPHRCGGFTLGRGSSFTDCSL